MKIIKTYESFNLRDLNLGRFSKRIYRNSIIPNTDGTFDYNGNLNFSYMDLNSLEEIPIRFKNVNGDFDCSDNNFINLEGSPEIVSGDFVCNSNYLINLRGLSKEIKGNLYCKNNNLLSKKYFSKINGNSNISEIEEFELSFYILNRLKKMTYEQLMAELDFFDKHDLKASEMFQEILDEMGIEYGTHRKKMKELIKGNDNLKALGY